MSAACNLFISSKAEIRFNEIVIQMYRGHVYRPHCMHNYTQPFLFCFFVVVGTVDLYRCLTSPSLRPILSFSFTCIKQLGKIGGVVKIYGFSIINLITE